MEQSNRKEILIIGDDPATKRLFASLPSDEWRVEFANGSADAIARVREKIFDLIVTGLQSPGATDVGALRQLRRIRPNVKLIVMTSDSTPAAVIDSIREHAFSYFSGPVLPEALNEMIHRGLQEPAWDDGVDVVSARPEWVTLRLRCRMLTAERVLQFMNELEADLPVKEKQDIGTAFREMLLNAMEHGGQMDPQQTVEVSCIRTRRMILYQIRDPGAGFAMDSLPHAAVSNPTDSPAAHIIYRSEHGMRPGGFGILLTKGMVDELIYNEKGNEVILVKHLKSEED